MPTKGMDRAIARPRMYLCRVGTQADTGGNVSGVMREQTAYQSTNRGNSPYKTPLVPYCATADRNAARTTHARSGW